MSNISSPRRSFSPHVSHADGDVVLRFGGDYLRMTAYQGVELARELPAGSDLRERVVTSVVIAVCETREIPWESACSIVHAAVCA